MTTHCQVCGRRLRDPASAARGTGPVCHRNGQPRKTTSVQGEIPMYPTLFTTPGVKAFAEAIDTERHAQLTKWGDQKHPDGTGLPGDRGQADIARRICQEAAAGGTLAWRHVLQEEVREALAESDPAALRAELLQVAAVCAAWIADIDTRPGAPS